MNRKAFDKINYGLFLVSAQAEGQQPQICVVNSLHQLTSSFPIKFSLTVNKSNETYKAIEAKGSFAATVLSQTATKDFVSLFGYKSGRVVNKFEGFQPESDENGNPYLKDHALARFACTVIDKLDLGNSVLYIAQVNEAAVLGSGSALTVEDFTNSGSTTPPTATVYRTMDSNAGWRCTICGYICDKDVLPDGYQCPLCRANKDKFVKQ